METNVSCLKKRQAKAREGGRRKKPLASGLCVCVWMWRWSQSALGKSGKEREKVGILIGK